MEKKLIFVIPARQVEGEIIDVYPNGTAKVRYLDHFSDDVRILKDTVVLVDILNLE